MRLYWDLMDSNAWRCLSATDQRVYLALARQLRKTNNGDLSLTASTAKHFGIKSKTTLAKSLRALAAVGLIAITRRGGTTRGGQRMPHLYRITDWPVYEIPAKHVDACKATFDWRNVTTVDMGNKLIALAEQAAQEAGEDAETHGQNLTHTGSKNGLSPVRTGSKNGHGAPPPGQKLTVANVPDSAASPMLARVSA